MLRPRGKAIFLVRGPSLRQTEEWFRIYNHILIQVKLSGATLRPQHGGYNSSGVLKQRAAVSKVRSSYVA